MAHNPCDTCQQSLKHDTVVQDACFKDGCGFSVVWTVRDGRKDKKALMIITTFIVIITTKPFRASINSKLIINYFPLGMIFPLLSTVTRIKHA